MKGDITKDMLCASLKKSLAHKTLDKISIKEITDDCGLNRQTFYYHFENIYQLMDWLLKNEAVSIFLDQGEDLNWQDGLTLLFDYLTANREMCLNALTSVGNQYVYRFFYDELFSLIRNNLKNTHTIPQLDEKQTEQLAQYTVISWGSYIVAWMMGIVKETPEEITDFLIGRIGHDHATTPDN
jgi:probable dihydroxyacetone kinase regulator